MFGVINIYKPKGMTSHDVVSVLRKKLNIKQVGHTGTLDPFAEGVLPVCVGKATRLIEYFDDDKEYLATVQFGSQTTTYDLEGDITQTSSTKITQTDLEKALEAFRGEILQTPPIYSAIKVNGKKLYEYAREGKEVKIEPRKVTIYKIELKNFDELKQQAEITIKCSKGTYISSIANYLGENLGCYGHLIKLVRTQAGKFVVENSVQLDDLDIKNKIQSPLEALSLPQINVNDIMHERISHGMSIKTNTDKIKIGDFLILIYNNNIDAIGVFDGECIKIKKVFIWKRF